MRGVLAVLVLAACGTTSEHAPTTEPAPEPVPGTAPAPAPVPEPAPVDPPPVDSDPSPTSDWAPEPGRPRPCPAQSEWPAGMACVLGGTFTLGFAEGRPDEREPGEVYVDTFYMDLTEVTNEAFEECIAAGACTRPMPFRHFGGARQPVVAVSWFDAVHHCERIGKRLPTDAEWERAASGPDHTQYPWGNEPAGCERANIMDERGEGCGTGRTHDVGTLPPGYYGLFDMAGNVHEWVQDHYSECLRGCDHECGDACFGDNPHGPCGGSLDRCPGFGLRSVRGGSAFWPLERARTTARRGSGAPNRGPHRFGFRCAQSLPP